jgi:very-short-patch-repair endonuclease
MSKKLFKGADKLIFARAAELRARPTYAEELLWQYLRTKPHGYKFRRQHPFAGYIFDFYCHYLKLVIEVDGPIHEKEAVKKNDEQRENYLKSQGLLVLRFLNEEVRLCKEKVIAAIEHHLLEGKIEQQKNSPS